MADFTAEETNAPSTKDRRRRDLVGASVLAVHAHPDDEAIWTGGLLAQLARRGADVTVVTCTLGEQGETFGTTYQGLVADAADQLGGFRHAELQGSLAVLGARGIYLGGAGRFRDSGMVGDPANQHPRAFIHSGQAAVDALVEIYRDIQPDLVITYGPDGGYGHPDHIRAHEIAHAAAEIVPVKRIVWAVNYRPEVDRGLSVITAPAGWRKPHPGENATVEVADFEVELSDVDVASKIEAMACHATQLQLADGRVSDVYPVPARAVVTDPEAAMGVFALTNLIALPITRREHYQLGAGVLADAHRIAGTDMATCVMAGIF